MDEPTSGQFTYLSLMTVRRTWKANTHTPTCCSTRTYSCVSAVVTRECHTLHGHLKCFSSSHAEMLVEKVETHRETVALGGAARERREGAGMSVQLAGDLIG